MKNQIHLDIKSPCTKDFNTFSPTAKGGFCGSCEKEVIDFTKMSAPEIITYFKTKETQNICGRFNSNQLTTYSQKPTKSKIRSIASGIGLACLSIFSITSAHAQEIKQDTKDKNNTTEINSTKEQKEFTVKGTIQDENGLPLPTASVILQNSTIGISTDFDGNFEFPKKLKKGDVLLVSYVGYETKKIVVTNQNSTSEINLQADMSLDTCVITGKVAVKKVYTSKRK